MILWASGMFGGRYHGFAFDDLCKKHRVRFLAIDRPGIGGTDLVHLDQRVQLWLEAVPAVLKQAGVKTVHLACHSAGTIYMLNTTLHLRHLLSPTQPFVAFFGPWVHPSKSEKWGLSVIRLLPQVAIGTWHHWAKLMSSTVAPVLTAVGVNATKAFHGPATIPLAPEQVTEDSEIGDGLDTTWRKASEAVISHFIYAEKLEGASQEALLCLRKGVSWGDWQEVDEAVLRMARQERERRSSDLQATPKIEVQLYFAEHDEMSGITGRNWLESCFKQPEAGDVLQVESEVVAGTDHNDILSLKSGAMERMVRTVAALDRTRTPREVNT